MHALVEDVGAHDHDLVAVLVDAFGDVDLPELHLELRAHLQQHLRRDREVLDVLRELEAPVREELRGDADVLVALGLDFLVDAVGVLFGQEDQSDLRSGLLLDRCDDLFVPQVALGVLTGSDADHDRFVDFDAERLGGFVELLGELHGQVRVF